MAGGWSPSRPTAVDDVRGGDGGGGRAGEEGDEVSDLLGQADTAQRHEAALVGRDSGIASDEGAHVGRDDAGPDRVDPYPGGPHSAASDRVSPSRALVVAVWSVVSGVPTPVTALDTVTIDPPPRLAMPSALTPAGVDLLPSCWRSARGATGTGPTTPSPPWSHGPPRLRRPRHAAAVLRRGPRAPAAPRDRADPRSRRSARSPRARSHRSSTDPEPDVFVAHFLVVGDPDRSREWYRTVFDGEVIRGRGPEIRAYLRDPDGHLIEVRESVA